MRNALAYYGTMLLFMKHIMVYYYTGRPLVEPLSSTLSGNRGGGYPNGANFKADTLMASIFQ
jgi:hypothetical protein